MPSDAESMRVAKVLDRYRVAITRDGKRIKRNAILFVGGTDVFDPDSGEKLGVVGDLMVKVTEVHDRFVVAETFRILRPGDQVKTVVNIGDPVVRR